MPVFRGGAQSSFSFIMLNSYLRISIIYRGKKLINDNLENEEPSSAVYLFRWHWIHYSSQSKRFKHRRDMLKFIFRRIEFECGRWFVTMKSLVLEIQVNAKEAIQRNPLHIPFKSTTKKTCLPIEHGDTRWSQKELLPPNVTSGRIYCNWIRG